MSALGARPREALRPIRLVTDGAASVVAAMTAADVPRLALVSAAVLFPEPSGFPYDVVRWLLKNVGQDLATAEAVLAGSELAWTIARPPRLVGGEDAGYRAEVGALPPGGTTLSFRALATFLVDALERGAHIREVVGVAK